jgi:hypothetical protein
MPAMNRMRPLSGLPAWLKQRKLLIRHGLQGMIGRTCTLAV